jgi:hypothetical protein
MQLAFALQLSNRGVIAGRTVSGKHVGRTIIGLAKALFKKILADSRSRVSER